MKTTKIVLALFLLTVCAGLLQSAEEKAIVKKSVLSNGGAVLSDENYTITGTVGQPFVGAVSGQTVVTQVGFWYTPEEPFTTSEEESTESVPLEFRLEQNYPNPFNPKTTIQFSLPEALEVTLKVYNLLGQEVATLVDGKLEADVHKFQFDGRRLASGVYIYRIHTSSAKEKAGGFVHTKKFLLLK